jgi:DNA-binding SARP family transcriptional activator
MRMLGVTAVARLIGARIRRGLLTGRFRSTPGSNRALNDCRPGTGVESPPDSSHLPAPGVELDVAGCRERLSVFLLGRPRVEFGGRVLERWPSRRGRFLFAYLAINHQKRASRDALMEMFWPHSNPISARNRLNVTLHGVRQLLQAIEARDPVILYENGSYFINPRIDLWLDVDEFKTAWEQGRRKEREGRIQDALSLYSRAAKLYAGDLMEDSVYEDWLSTEREHLKEVYLVILDKISQHLSLDGDPDTAICLCESMLEKDSCQEEVHRRLMLCYYRLGFRDKALKQYQRCTEILRKELGVEPTTETVRLYQSIKGEPAPSRPDTDGDFAPGRKR